jgi:hypothetical protein
VGWTPAAQHCYLNGNADPLYAAELEQRLESLAEGIRDAEEAMSALRIQSAKVLEFAIWIRKKP